jgi:hypothetical protein
MSKVYTLCGSSRFPQAFHLVNAHLSLQGHVVISLGLFGHADEPVGAQFLTSDGDETTAEKVALDQLHFRKIDLSDAIFVVNVGGYIGSSTKREIAYAESRGKAVEWLFPPTSLSAEVERLKGERDANHNLAIANGSRAKEEEARAEAAEAEVVRLKAQRDEARNREEAAWTRANAAESKVSAWESIVCVVGGPMRVAPNVGWGPGSDERVIVPAITSERLTNILDKLADASSRADAAEARVAVLECEVETLRRYGNKDCTAYADEKLEELRAGRRNPL